MSLSGVPLHVVQRGNNRQTVFFHQSCYSYYLDKLFESAKLYDVSVHAFVCMTNHVHILVTPAEKYGVSQMMQRLGSLYTATINALYDRTGVRKGLPTGSNKFNTEIEQALNIRISCGRRGRPKKGL